MVTLRDRGVGDRGDRRRHALFAPIRVRGQVTPPRQQRSTRPAPTATWAWPRHPSLGARRRSAERSARARRRRRRGSGRLALGGSAPASAAALSSAHAVTWSQQQQPNPSQLLYPTALHGGTRGLLSHAARLR
eukprot:1039788-Rhodomonas_salina.5